MRSHAALGMGAGVRVSCIDRSLTTRSLQALHRNPTATQLSRLDLFLVYASVLWPDRSGRYGTGRGAKRALFAARFVVQRRFLPRLENELDLIGDSQVIKSRAVRCVSQGSTKPLKRFHRLGKAQWETPRPDATRDDSVPVVLSSRIEHECGKTPNLSP